MKILVVNPPNVPFSSSGILIEPIDILSAATYIASLGHEVSLLDMDVRKIDAADFSTHAKDGYDAAFIVFDYHIPLHCDGSLQAAMDIAGQAKATGAKVALAGKAATYTPERFLFHGSPVDALIRHEAEPSLEALLSLEKWTSESLTSVPSLSFLAKDGRIASTDRPAKPFDLGRLPIPDRGLVRLPDYIDVRTILSSRGCHMKCDFCHVPGFWGGWRGRSPASVADEIELLVKDFGAQKILFLDDNAPVGRRRMLELCAELRARRIRVPMGCLASLDCFDPALMGSMLEAGFRWIHYGAESGSDRLLATIHKRSDAAQARQAIAQTKAMGLRVRASWIMDLPTSTEDEILRTADLIMETRAHEVRLHHLALRLGSSIGKLHADVPSTQYIHQGSQNQNLSAADPMRVRSIVESVAAELAGSGYALVRSPDEFIDPEALRSRCVGMQVVSLCPLRYGLDWTF